MPQQSMPDFIKDLEKINQLKRVTGPVRIDEVPSLMEECKGNALLIERIKDYDFSFLADAYSTREQYATALGCDKREIPSALVDIISKKIKPVSVDTAPCKEVILKGKDVDLTIFPLFLHHEYDGNAYIQDTNVVSRHPETGLINWGIYRLMYRSRNETNVDMRNDSHNARIIALEHLRKGVDMPVAVVIGGPTLDKIASMYSFPGVDDWDVLGGFYGEPARVVKCETNDLTVPANAEIVLEGRIMTSEGWIYDEGPYGEATGTYGGGLPRNCRLIVDCVTHRKNCVFQHATIGGMQPGFTDMQVMNIAIEAEILKAMKNAGLDVLDIYMHPGGCQNIMYARLKVKAAGDAKQALALMLSSSRQWFPKMAYVFDEDIDIFDENRVKWALAWRFNPGRGTMVIPDLNILPLDPIAGVDHPPVSLSKIGFDCTVPLIGAYDEFSFAAARIMQPLGEPKAGITAMTEEELTKKMSEYIRESPRTWREIITHFHGQSNPLIYRAFGNIRSKLGRVADRRPDYPYTFADTWFVYENKK